MKEMSIKIHLHHSHFLLEVMKKQYGLFLMVSRD